ncbi:MAG: hypothetical protein JNN11_05005 [Candidatus Doudnabacteria bacterium]|nr:hypothetical protein [Candidatus Doudnabacteria bacterium]
MSFISLILEGLTGITESVPYPYEKAFRFVCKYREWELRHYRSTIAQMRERGLVTVSTLNGQKFITCTKKGQLELLINKAVRNRIKKWDHKWRLIIFDIPEKHREKRDQLRWILKKNDFIKFQASVFISPYPLNTDAINYLKQSGLIDFIRILQVSKIDDDTGLRKKFSL